MKLTVVGAGRSYAESKRRDNLATFPGFASLDEVPERGVSVGLGTSVVHDHPDAEIWIDEEALP